MLFNSVEFLLFFPVLFLLYFAVPQKWRTLLLLLSSYYFYMCWKAEYVILIAASTAVDYFAGLRMSRLPGKKGRGKFLLLSLAVNLGLLFAFKYVDFFTDSFRSLLEQFDVFCEIPAFDLLLPVGISFYTFQTLSYSIDIYRGRTKPERNPVVFALYVSFWPQLVSGPIERSGDLIPQLRRFEGFDYARVRSGLLRMLIGFFKKLVIADRLAVYVEAVYGDPGAFGGGAMLLATYFFAFQVYCDFSGYCDIAIGAARVMGIRLTENFRTPYFSRSLVEFWRRWHITLASWFRDYVYISLGGSRVVRWRWRFNLVATFLLSGLWHGAGWNFVLWGAFNGVLLAIGTWIGPMAAGLPLPAGFRRVPWLQVLGTFHLVIFGYMIFRAESVGDAALMFERVFCGLFAAGAWSMPLPGGVPDLVVSVVVTAALVLLDFAARGGTIEDLVLRRPWWARWPFYVALVLLLLWFGVFTENRFIYYQF